MNMKIFKNYNKLLSVNLLLAIAMCSGTAFARYIPYKGDKGSHVEAPAKSAVYSPNTTIMHIEMAKAEIMHDDFVPPSNHIKAARAESEKVTGNPDVIKKANANIVQAQIKVKDGNIKGAIDELDKALELYNSLKSE